MLLIGKVGLIFSVVIFAIVCGVFMFLEHRKVKNIKTKYYLLSFIIPIVLLGGSCLLMYKQIPSLSTEKVISAIENWREDIFEKEYVSTLPTERIDVTDFVVEGDELYAMLDTDKEVKRLRRSKDFDEIKLSGDGSMYIEAKWVEKIEGLPIHSHFSDVVLYKP
jgi:hypothetical protein